MAVDPEFTYYAAPTDRQPLIRISADEVRSALRIDESNEPLQFEAKRLIQSAFELVRATLGDAALKTTPESVMKQAILRITGYMMESPLAFPGQGFANVVRNSGAGRMLAPYKPRGAGVVG